MEWLGVVLASVALGGMAWVHQRSQERFERLETAPTPPPSSYDDSELRAAFQAALDQLEERLDDQEGQIREQTLAISKGIEHVDRAERRVRAVVGRAKKRMEDLGYADAGLDAEAEELRRIDEAERGAEGVPTMHGSVERPEPVDLSAFPGDWRGFGG